MSKKGAAITTASIKILGFSMFVVFAFIGANILIYTLTDDGYTDPAEAFSDIKELNFGDNYVSNVMVVELPKNAGEGSNLDL